jgi:hypothetical protein
MLSPNATNRVARIRGGITTVIVKLHELVRCSASVTEQLTVDAPSGNVDPDAGVHAISSGGAPSRVLGGA